METAHVAFETLLLGNEIDHPCNTEHPIAFATSSDPDTMHLDEAMRAPDRVQFQKAMRKEINDQMTRKHWVIVPRSEVPIGMKVLPCVWSMKRKRRIDTREVYKWKARLTVHGGRQEYGVNYWETYSPVVTWSSIRLFLTLTTLAGWKTRQIDYVLAFPQADVECDMYIDIPRGFNFKGSKKTHALKLLKNVYGTKQAGRVWNKHLAQGLIDKGFTQSRIDECVFYKKGYGLILIYVDDCILCGPTTEGLDAMVKLLSNGYEIEDQGEMSDYLGVSIKRDTDGSIRLTQPHLIDQILTDLGLNQPYVKTHPTPAQVSPILGPDLDAPHVTKAGNIGLS